MRFDRIAYLRLNCLFSPQFLSENRFTLFGNCSSRLNISMLVCRAAMQSLHSSLFKKVIILNSSQMQQQMKQN